MASTVTLKQHDTKIIFTDVPKIDGVTLIPGDLTGATCSFILKSGTTVIKAPATIGSTTGEAPGPPTVAQFQYAPVPGDVANTGDFQQEWEVVYPSGKILTFPNDSYNTVKIIADLG